MINNLQPSDYGKTFTINELKQKTGKSPRTFRRWREAGYLKVVKRSPLTYLVQDPKTIDGKTLIPVDSNPVDGEAVLSAKHVEDLTEEIKSYKTILDFLKATEEAKTKVHIAHPPKTGKAIKILSLSDLHIPFHDKELIMKIIEEHSDADICVLNGDLIDCYAASKYSQNKLVSIGYEYNLCLDFLLFVRSVFDKVIVTRGNHEERTDRYFSSKIDPHMSVLAQKDILSRICSGYVYNEKGELVGQVPMDNVIYNPNGQPWFALVNKTLFMHPSSYSGRPMATSVAAQLSVENFVDRSDYDCIVLGHTHKVGKIVEKGKLLIEQGCLCEVMDYQKEGKYIRRPQVLGYAVIYQDKDGNTNFNDSNYYYCGTLNAMKS